MLLKELKEDPENVKKMTNEQKGNIDQDIKN